MPPEVLTRLLRGEHLNMAVRIALGVWPHPPLRMAELIDHLAEILRREDWFPRPQPPLVEGANIPDGGFIERQGPDRFVYRTRRGHVTRPNVLADESEEVFTDARHVAAHYLRWNLGLPGDLDGWRVIE